MKKSVVGGIAAAALALLAAGAARTQPAQPNLADLEKLGARIAAKLAQACPMAARDDVDAHAKCAAALRTSDEVPMASSGILWGGDQPELRLSKRKLTHFKPDIFRQVYLSLFSFTGQWSASIDPRERVGVISVQAYFRNALPPGEFPYPFWHSADKWSAYETANVIRFYFNREGQVFVVTRSKDGSEANRGTWAHVTPPTFTDWQWSDPAGGLQPHATLFSNRYSAGNPHLVALDKAYRDFAAEARKGTCLTCHAPNNEAGMDHLVLLQTPVHASGEIDDVLEEVRSGKMPQDDLGMRKPLPADLRAAILRTGGEFKRELDAADQWEAARH
ncbi:MAG: hypothetical protein WDN25_17810 [Acetobacteraceae bacterium]